MAVVTAIDEAHEHRAISAVCVPHPNSSNGGTRKTGVFQRETCACGATRHVWINTFNVVAGAWDTEASP